MKKIIPFLLITLTLNTYAQRNSGFKIGSNISWTTTNRTQDLSFQENHNIHSTATFHIGYSWNIPVTQKISLQTDLIYNWKGSESTLHYPDSILTALGVNDPSVIIDGVGLERTNYISLPLTFSYHLLPQLCIELGGETAYALRSGAEPWEFSLISGVGYCTKYADLTLRYIHGFSNTNSSNWAMNYTDKNRTLQLSLTIPIFKYFKRKE